MKHLSASFFAASVVTAFLCHSALAAQRAFVKSTGDDANAASGCLLAAPCRTFAGALPVVDAGGEIIALDAAGYAAVTIDKSVSLIGNPGFFAGIAHTGANAITINTPGVNVILRGLTINGISASYGIAMTNGASLTVENCVISNFTIGGILVTSASQVRVIDSLFRGNQTAAMYIKGGTVDIVNSKFAGNYRAVLAELAFPATAVVNITDSAAVGNTRGFVAATSGSGQTVRMTVTRSTITDSSDMGVFAYCNGAGASTTVTVSGTTVANGTAGLQNSQTGCTSTLESMGNNTVRQNLIDTIGTITSVSQM